MNDSQAAQIARTFEETRDATLRLFDLVSEADDLHLSPGFGFRPVIWHLAHIGVFEAYWLLQTLRRERALDARYERIFNPIETPREASKELPSRGEMEAYLLRVRARVRRVLEAADFRADDPLLRDGYVFDLVLEHERQHQETLLYLLMLLDPSKKTRPKEATGMDGGTSRTRHASGPHAQGEMLSVPEGSFEMGAGRDGFAYDNELPAHHVSLPAYRISRLLTTNEEYAHFVAGGGYERRELWSEEGWEWREREGWTQPLYWTRAAEAGGVGGDEARGDGGVVGWSERRMFESVPLEALHPVTGVSWYEAEAYARFRGRRLPTEAEWERASRWDAAGGRSRRYSWGDGEPTSALCNFDTAYWGTTPIGSFPEGASAVGCLDMTGNVWEWTADAFAGFEGFRAFPYPEYSQAWFDGDHRVLKGGSWATHPSVLRNSFRNFFRRHFRIAFAGIRLAEDA
jgi:iron(II)-dependent oxidoreductase